MVSFDATHYVINDFVEWDERNELVLAPKFQRRSVWSDKARSYLMDTIIRGFPISKIYMRHDVDPKTRKSRREIVDGQQRLRTILSYLADGFKISRIHNEEYGGVYFSQLPEEVQKGILGYKISVDILLGAMDTDVLDIFARLNTYTVKLNKQELRNAQWFGLFKKVVYSLGYEFGEFLIQKGVLTEGKVTRMADAELASELVIQLIDGIQDRKKIDSYYRKYDEVFDEKDKMIEEFREVMSIISGVFGDSLFISNFKNLPLFYSLFGVINELKPKKDQFPKIAVALQDIDSILASNPEELSGDNAGFYDASTKHVTDLSRRKIRHEYIKNTILNRLQ